MAIEVTTADAASSSGVRASANQSPVDGCWGGGREEGCAGAVLGSTAAGACVGDVATNNPVSGACAALVVGGQGGGGGGGCSPAAGALTGLTAAAVSDEPRCDEPPCVLVADDVKPLPPPRSLPRLCVYVCVHVCVFTP